MSVKVAVQLVRRSSVGLQWSSGEVWVVAWVWVGVVCGSSSLDAAHLRELFPVNKLELDLDLHAWSRHSLVDS